ncbi:hypothetical protein [Streptomyces sp. TR02-1]|uniref:hypothetical protein n=1 Tax=Streptomyces sp. TR02-1 TaxID=3385977 RepID=UPI00399F4312
MEMAVTGVRGLRAAVFTAVCVTLSSGAHILLSGTPVPPTTLAVVGGAVFLIAFALADRERGFGRIASLLVPLELFADTVFTSGQHACYGPGGGPVTGPLRSVGLDVLCAGGHAGMPLARMAPAPGVGQNLPGLSPWLLLAAHLGVGLLAAVWLRRGEAAAARLLGAAAATAFRPLRLAVRGCPAPTGTFRRPPRPAPATAPRRLPPVAHPVLRRGPPCETALAV